MNNTKDFFESYFFYNFYPFNPTKYYNYDDISIDDIFLKIKIFTKYIKNMLNSNNIEIKDGRFGPYITNGKINATIKKGTDLETVSLKDAIEIINEKAKKSPKKRRFNTF